MHVATLALGHIPIVAFLPRENSCLFPALNNKTNNAKCVHLVAYMCDAGSRTAMGFKHTTQRSLVHHLNQHVLQKDIIYYSYNNQIPTISNYF